MGIPCLYRDLIVQSNAIWGCAGNPTREGAMKKKDYESPTIVHTEKLEGRAVLCNKADDACAGGTISS